MNNFIKRQFSGFLGTGDTSLDTNTYGPFDKPWVTQDVYPSNILRLESGKFISVSVTVPAGMVTEYTCILPSSYDTTKRLSFTLKTDQNLRIKVVSPSHADSTGLIYAPIDQFGLYVLSERITSIKIETVAFEDALVEYFAFEVPDLTVEGSWLFGTQTVGIVTND